MTISLLVIWWKRRNNFPLKERSTYLSMFLIFTLGVSLQFSFWIVIRFSYNCDEYNSLDSAVFKSFFLFCKFSFFPIYFLKAARIYYAFNYDLKYSFLNWIFEDEKKLLFITIVISFLIGGLPTLLNYRAYIIAIENSNQLDDDN